MSRLYFTATMKHSSLGIDLPVFSFETADHTGGGYHLGGLHPSAIAALGGKGPELKKQERFDLKFNVNAKRTSLSLIVNTKKHIPHVEWSSETGTGPLPLGVSTILPMITGGKSSSNSKKSDSGKSSTDRSRSQRSNDSRRSRGSRHESRYEDRYDDRYDDKYDRYDDRSDRYEDRNRQHGSRSRSDSRSRR